MRAVRKAKTARAVIVGRDRDVDKSSLPGAFVFVPGIEVELEVMEGW